MPPDADAGAGAVCGDGGACWAPIPAEPLLWLGLLVLFSTVLKYVGCCWCWGYAVFGGGRGGIVALLLTEATRLSGSVARSWGLAGFGVDVGVGGGWVSRGGASLSAGEA